MIAVFLFALLAQAPLTVADVQREVSAVLMGAPCPYDTNGDGDCDVLDVETMIADVVAAAPGCTTYSMLFTSCLAPVSQGGCVPGVQFTQAITACIEP